MSSKSMGTIAGLVFMVAVIGGFFWLWNQTKKLPAPTPISANLEAVSIETVKKDADDILNSLVKNSDIPIPVPLEKMGKANPFVNN